MKKLSNMIPSALQGFFAKPVPCNSEVEPLEMPLLRRRAPRGALLRIACPDPTTEEMHRDRHQYRAQWLVRQERWEEMAALLHDADENREMTPGGMPVAELMAFGARADVILAAEHALFDGKPASDAPLMAGIEALEHVLADHSKSHVIAAIVAQAHMDIGWAWRGTGWDGDVPARNRTAFEAHFDRAEEILVPFEKDTAGSPLLAATRCALLGGSGADARMVADRYERLIDLNPENPRPMRAMGNHLLPRWHGSYDQLELEARRTAARTEETWGAGGYTWVQFDAISCDARACANLDLPFFIEGLRDILERRPDPHTANLLASYCASAIGQAAPSEDAAGEVRAEIADCARWIVRDHMTELHPLLWAHAARGFDNNLRVRSPSRFAASGREEAMRIITGLFQREIEAGKRVIFTEGRRQIALPG
ncbi:MULTISPECIES: hypothetical protein [Sulfitobacter]|jgi:hypothetical protein|uniref:HD domain-containing protein n=1 Tax=Sulfitobacter dubius TaxID=218673 RepID=A0ABY3ZI37_9RHOB|nr:hypothetical protein [Sulfitobacter dubius]UOA14329.1 hypothetical protein DSM109990_01130 [Sulfitobacter dubius]WOI30181.1 hypothetical protein R1T39_05610 [Sulfitobacter dubius]